MPIFDPTEQRMAVRVVYDGVACAGKTTNVRQLCTLFIAQQKSDVETPAEMSGRTLYFDWLSIMAGQVCGFPLLCQVVSVPGQVVLTPRRQHLLGSADVVVYVCESHPAGIEAAKAGLALYDRIAAERGIAIPLVIQANKQDQRGALDSADLLKALGREGTPVIEAIASEGVLGLTEATRGVVATASLRDVNAGELPIDASRTVSLIASGHLSVDLRVENGAGRGVLRLDDGVFPVLARGEAPLAKVGLRLPGTTASAPATCTIGLSERGWTFGDVYAAVPGCVATGRLDVDPAGVLDGALVVALGKELLETGTMTSLLTERLTVPVRITGSAAAPVVDADLAATFGSFMTNNRVAAVFRSKESVAPPPAPVVELPPIEARDLDREASTLRAWIRAGADWTKLP